MANVMIASLGLSRWEKQMMEKAYRKMIAVSVPPPLPIPEATIVPETTMDASLRAQYVALATELQVTQRGLLADAARAYFIERGIRLYDQTLVHAYLERQYGPVQGTYDPRTMERPEPTWGWRPLRQQDRLAAGGGSYFVTSPDVNGDVWRNIESYSKPIPLPVLLTAKDIVSTFPTAHLYVSDEIKKNEHVKDPFLMVVIDGERFIVERWDEPAYRE